MRRKNKCYALRPWGQCSVLAGRRNAKPSSFGPLLQNGSPLFPAAAALLTLSCQPSIPSALRRDAVPPLEAWPSADSCAALIWPSSLPPGSFSDKPTYWKQTQNKGFDCVYAASVLTLKLWARNTPTKKLLRIPRHFFIKIPLMITGDFTSFGRTEWSSTPPVSQCGRSSLSSSEHAAPTALGHGPPALDAWPCVQPAPGTGWADDPGGLAGPWRWSWSWGMDQHSFYVIGENRAALKCYTTCFSACMKWKEEIALSNSQLISCFTLNVFRLFAWLCQKPLPLPFIVFQTLLEWIFLTWGNPDTFIALMREMIEVCLVFKRMKITVVRVVCHQTTHIQDPSDKIHIMWFSVSS